MVKFWKNRKKKVSQEVYDAMVTLLDHYRNLTPMVKCPLCVVSKSCINCPWELFESKDCIEWFYFITELRFNPEDYPIQRSQRIIMLENWISRSKVKS